MSFKILKKKIMAYLFKYQQEAKFITNGINIYIVDIANIIYIEYDDDKAKINLVNGKTISDTRTLKEIREELHEFGFYQIDKSTLVNLRYITEINTTENGKCLVKFAEMEKNISRRKQKEMRDLFKSNLLKSKNNSCSVPNCPFRISNS